MTKKYDYFLQDANNDCGIACLLTIFYQFGCEISKNDLLQQIKLKPEGISAYELINASKKLGLNAYGVKTVIDKISNNMLPCIAHTIQQKNYFHYIVILENDIINKKIKIMDPAIGITNLTYNEFNDITTNIFLIFDSSKTEKKKDQRFKKYIYSIFLENKKIITKCLIVSIVFILMSLLFNYYLKIMLINLNNTYKYLFLILLVFIVILLLKNGIDYLKNILILKLNNKIDKKLTKKVLKQIICLPYKYYKEKSTGEILNVINDIENFKEIITKVFVLCLINAFLILFVLIYTAFFSIIYSIVLLLFIFVVCLITIKYQYCFNDIYIRIKKSKMKYTSKTIEMISSYDTIKNLNIENKVSNFIFNDYKELLKNNSNYSRKYYNYNLITNIIIEFFYLILVFLATIIIIYNNIDSSYLVLLSSVFYIVFDFMASISECLSMYKIYETSINRILDVLDIEEEKFSLSGLSNINSIEYKNVSFKNDKYCILKNINLSLYKGQKMFITGNSGVGKSTMVKLLLKYYELFDGEIFINEQNIKDIDLGLIRNSITYVSQDEKLLCDSIINNLKMVNPSFKKIKIATKTTFVDEIIKCKKIDLNYILEDNGSNLSGGERKKIILARALLKKSKFLILDEVFNEMDIITERKILNNIFKYYPQVTIVLISHRKNNIDLFDKVFELKEE